MDNNNCDHEGKHAPLVQSVVSAGSELLVITCHNCMGCGKVFVSQIPIKINSSGIVSATGMLPHKV